MPVRLKGDPRPNHAKGKFAKCVEILRQQRLENDAIWVNNQAIRIHPYGGSILVAGPFLDDVPGDARCQQQRGAGVAKAVNRDPENIGRGNQVGKFPVAGIGLVKSRAKRASKAGAVARRRQARLRKRPSGS